jgi:hypothetical protein
LKPGQGTVHIFCKHLSRATNQPAIQNRSTYVKWKETFVMPAQRFGERQVNESARSAEVRAELREQGYKIMWDVQQDLTRVSYATQGAGKEILALEHAVDLKWQAWDAYRRLTGDSNIAKTYQAQHEYTNEGK